MIKKVLRLCVIALCLLSMVACGGIEVLEVPSLPTEESSVTEEPAVVKPTLYQNPLTGVRELKKRERNQRPVAIMVNNISQAQRVQCGLNDADLVFECLVEGGISRLMAVFYNVEEVGQIGTIRSARYSYAQLSQGLDAIYVHHGSDQKYAKPYMNNCGMDRYEIGSAAGFRENNGLATEHTLYTKGETLAEQLEESDFRVKNQKATKSVFKFGKKAVTPENPCENVTYAMSSSYRTTFRYNETTGKYTRCPNGEIHRDYKSDKKTVTDNVFVLYAGHSYFEDNYHLQTLLSSGEGLYISKGGYQEIQWEKGDGNDPLKFTDKDGDPLTVNPGKSWIAFVPQGNQDMTEIE
jgi:hypothetical protein